MNISTYVERRPELSHREIAAQLGISRPFLTQLLNGSRGPSRATILHIEKASGGEIDVASWFPMPAAAP
ncbi:helix-turn-helix domain-containing protein [Thalassovita litoralis]|uniref:helix-turn-helix domain-containing protein n=1 Tax=Thalassovita litoralis TaxID=1010611 RepID=UPI0038B46A94